jgi:hypothetical protein
MSFFFFLLFLSESENNVVKSEMFGAILPAAWTKITDEVM